MSLDSLVKAGDYSPEVWHRWRREGIGASDAGVICGLSPWRSGLAVWLEKTGRTPEPKPEQETEWQRWGKRLERVMVEEFTDKTGLVVAGEGTWHERPDAPWQRATLDGLVFETLADTRPEQDAEFLYASSPLGVLELKTSSWRSPLSWDDGPPKLYAVQVQHQLMVTGLEMGFLAVLHDGSRFRIHELERDPEVISALEEIEYQFWHCVEHDDPPPSAGDRATEIAVRAAFPDPQPGAVIEMSQDVCAHARAYARLQEQRGALEEQLTAHRTELMLALGSAEVGADQQGEPLVTWKPFTATSVDLDRLRAEHPDLIGEYTRRTSSRRLIVKPAALTAGEEKTP
jgi:putative phage-type endonuclease